MKIIILLAILTTLAHAEPISWPANKSCAAWWTKKTMFLFRSLEPVGMNCDLTLSLNESPDKKRQVVVSIPLNKFNSGEPDRDEDVVKILKGDIEPNLRFETLPLDEGQWTSLLKGEMKTLAGKLQIGHDLFDLQLEITMHEQGEKQFIEGFTETTFSAFKIKPPRVAGGVVASVKDILRLHFHILAKDIQNLH